MEILLDKNELFDLGDNLYGIRVTCSSGSCWLTQAGDSRDHILYPGQSFHIQKRGRLVVTATADCRLRLIEAAEGSVRNSLCRQLRGKKNRAFC